jgi:hypothetical protein
MAKINQKYFGNRNIGTGGDEVTGGLSNSQNYADDKIGGEGIASVNFSDAGSWIATAGTPFSGLVLPPPTLPGGVQATWTINYGLYDVTTGAGKAGLVVNDTYTYPAYPGSVVRVASTSGSNATFTVVTDGSSTTLPTDTQGVNLTKLTGSGVGVFLVDVFSHIVSAPINEKGSGYTGAETFTTTRTNSSSGGIPVGTIVLTTDDGIPYSAGNQENAIIAYAKTTSGGTSKPADIIRQRSTNRFKVVTADGTAICTLKSSAVSAEGEMTITATDATGGTYFVTKIGSRRCTITRGNGTTFDSDSSVPWTFTSPAPAGSVSIANA